jgi:transcriptional regulator GlxA family with amidase domain
MGIIENGFGTALNADTLAQRIGISYSHLNRLFHQHLSQSVADYLTEKRVEHALHLLTHSNLPIIAIAQMVGIPDLQHFNKFMRRRCGLSPRKVRQEGVAAMLGKTPSGHHIGSQAGSFSAG